MDTSVLQDLRGKIMSSNLLHMYVNTVVIVVYKYKSNLLTKCKIISC